MLMATEEELQHRQDVRKRYSGRTVELAGTNTRARVLNAWPLPEHHTGFCLQMLVSDAIVTSTDKHWTLVEENQHGDC